MDLPSRAWLSNLFASKCVGDVDRVALLNGGPAASVQDLGPLVGSCFAAN
ncbi:MAG: hypothetical protein SXG53_07345 [Pseudomonadota bacterium]|nr:hypothetical protein [Pseudomonadota bacterium]